MSQYRLAAAFLSSALIIGGLYFYPLPKAPSPVKQEKVQPVEQAHGVGVIDIEQIEAVYSDFELLHELRGRQLRMRLELNQILKPVNLPEPPKIEEKPFDDSAREKIMQEFMSKLSDLKAKKISLIEKYRKETEPEYIRNRNAVREIFLNEALNITLKLENADNLRLTKEQYEELQAQLESIVAERNRRQAEMRENWIQEINNRVTAEISVEEKSLRKEYEDALKLSEEESTRKIREVQERNQALMDKALYEIEYRKTRQQELLDGLEYTTKELDALENEIIDAIADEAGKLAAMNKLQLVVVKRDKKFTPKRISFAPPVNSDLKKSPGAVIFFGKDTVDLTQDLIKTMKLKGRL